jgi:hypothetical protein
MVLATLFIWALAQEWAEPREDVQRAVITEKALRRSGLLVRGYVDTNRISRGESLRFWVMFRATTSLDSLQVTGMSTPGFVPVDNCWSDGQPPIPICPPGRVRDPRRWPLALRAGETAIVTADLRAQGWSGQFAPMLLFAWKPTNGSIDQDGLAIGPVEVESLATRVPRFFRRLFSALKDLALPIILLVAGVLFDRSLNSEKTAREKQQQEEKEERERQRAEDDRLLRERAQLEAERSAVLKLMLPTIYQYCERYYNRVAAAILALTAAHLDAKAGRIDEEERFRRCFYHLMTVHRTAAAMHRAIGAFFFRDRDGEDIAGGLWTAFFLRSDEYLRYPDRQLVLGTMPFRATFTTFERVLASEPAAAAADRLREGFRRWEADRFWDTDIHVLRLFGSGLAFESNRALELWYGRPEIYVLHGNMPEFSGALRVLQARNQQALADAVHGYFERVAKPALPGP